MDVLLMLVCLLGFPVLLVGLIRPSLYGGGRARALVIGLGMIVGGFVGFGLTHEPDERIATGTQQSIATPATSLAAPQGVVPRPPTSQAIAQAASQPVAVPIPEAQAALLDVVARYADRFRAAPNDLVRGAERPARAREICRVVPSAQVRGWVGAVSELSSTRDGKGVFAVRLDGRTRLTTWNNGLSDLQFGTLIAPEDPLWQKVSALRLRQRVVVDGAFFRRGDDCLGEASLSVAGAMTDPEFVFRFTDVRLAPQ